MSTAAVENSNLKLLASALEDDIRRRGLRPGDRYLTASQARKQFNASEMSIHRAMQLLAEEDFLVRQRGAGTFVGSKFKVVPERWCPLQIIHVVMSMDCQRIATLPAELLVEHLGEAMPDAVVEVHYVPDHDSLRHLDRIVSRITEENLSKEGMILIRSSRQMQLFIEESGLPAVVFGSVFSAATKLSSIDVDQHEVGKLMARYVLAEKCQRLVLLMRDDWRHGDNAMYSGITEELASGGLGFEALALCCVPPERDHIVEKVQRILSEGNAPCALICRNQMYADAAGEALRTLNLQNSVLLVAGGGRKLAGSHYAYVTPEIDEAGQVQMLGRMLLDQSTHEKPQVQTEVVPVHICLP